MRDVVARQERHLLFCGAHKHEASCEQQERRQVLEAVDLQIHIATFWSNQGVLVLQYKGDLDDSGKSGGHESIAKHSVDMRTQSKALWVSRHSPAGHEDHDSWNDVPLWPTLSIS